MKIDINDDNVYYPLGGASYVFKNELIKYIYSKIKKKNIKISIGAQPNSSPHLGTISVISLAFCLAKKIMKEYPDIKCSVLFEAVDTAPGEQVIINNVTYQKSLKNTGILQQYMPQFIEILESLKKKTNINYEIRYQNEFNNQNEIKDIVNVIINKRNEISKYLDPKYEKLRIRISCPKCGLTDKNSINNKYKDNKLICNCPIHGDFELDINKDSNLLEYNTPLRNLIRGMLYGNINNSNKYDYEIIRITGSDYAGFYQEELLYKVADMLNYNIQNLPIIIYSPLITDWSGAKLSKSLYVREGAYKYLPQYLINYEKLIKEKGNKGLDIVYNIVSEWLENPYKLFRNYSIYYFMERFENDYE